MPVYTYTNLDDPLVPGGTFAHGINNAGQIVGQYRDANGKGHGFLYDPSRGVFPPFFTIDPPLSR